jgi:hypothetical protein
MLVKATFQFQFVSEAKAKTKDCDDTGTTPPTKSPIAT